MKALHAVLICLLMFAIFSYTAVELRPLIQQDDNLIPMEKTSSYNSRKIPPRAPRGKPGSIISGDPIEDPKPNR